jgi:hypothetical protein
MTRILWILIAVWIVSVVLNSIVIFMNFFIRDSAEFVTDSISSLITVSAGVPGKVKTTFTKPSMIYRYTVYFNKKLVFVSAQYTEEGGIFSSLTEMIKSWLSFLPSSSGIEFESQEDQIEDFLAISIDKIYDNELKINAGRV